MRPQVAVLALLLALLAGLVLTAVVRLRELASRTDCRNKLHQLGIAVQNCHETAGRLPPLAGEKDDPRSVFGVLIPYLESTPYCFVPGETPAETWHAHSSTNFSHPNKMGGAGSSAGGIANLRWKLFLCPADTTADGLRDVPVTHPDGGTGYYATGSYAANRSVAWGTKTPAVGSPHAILFAERPQVCRTASGENVHNLWGVGFDCPQTPAFTPSPEFATPFQRIERVQPCDPRLPGSSHADGMQAVAGDGSVRVFSYRSTPREFWAACGAE